MDRGRLHQSLSNNWIPMSCINKAVNEKIGIEFGKGIELSEGQLGQPASKHSMIKMCTEDEAQPVLLP